LGCAIVSGLTSPAPVPLTTAGCEEEEDRPMAVEAGCYILNFMTTALKGE